MKGYRTPSWFRMKGFLQKKQAKSLKNKPRAAKTRGAAEK
jgi:hypothetical protein